VLVVLALGRFASGSRLARDYSQQKIPARLLREGLAEPRLPRPAKRFAQTDCYSVHDQSSAPRLYALLIVTGGGGGGRPTLVRPGGTDPEKLGEAIAAAEQTLLKARSAEAAPTRRVLISRGPPTSRRARE
jgi:hypothetical protein